MAALRECLWDPAAEVREAAAASLRKLAPDDGALPAAANRDPDDEVRLAAKPDPALIRRLVPWVVPNWRLRLVGQLPDPGPLADEVEADTRGQHAEDRLRAAAWLARHQPERRAEMVALLTAALECWDPLARAEAARLLRGLGGAKAALARHAERDPARAVRRAAR